MMMTNGAYAHKSLVFWTESVQRWKYHLGQANTLKVHKHEFQSLAMSQLNKARAKLRKAIHNMETVMQARNKMKAAQMKEITNVHEITRTEYFDKYKEYSHTARLMEDKHTDYDGVSYRWTYVNGLLVLAAKYSAIEGTSYHKYS